MIRYEPKIYDFDTVLARMFQSLLDHYIKPCGCLITFPKILFFMFVYVYFQMPTKLTSLLAFCQIHQQTLT